MKLLKSAKLELQSQTEYGYKKIIQRTAEAIARKPAMLKFWVEKEFKNYNSWKSHLVIGFVLINNSVLLPLRVMFALNCYSKLHIFRRISHKLAKPKTPLKPIMAVGDQHLDRL